MTDQRPGPRFLIARLRGMGETIQTLPVALALRQAYPNCFIGWVCENKNVPLLEGHAAIDRIIGLPTRWWTRPRILHEVRKQLRSLRIESTIDCEGSFGTAFACRLSGSPHRIGMRGRHRHPAAALLNNHLLVISKRHLTDRALELLKPLGVHGAAVRWDLPIGVVDRQFARTFVRGSELGSEYAVIAPGAVSDAARWAPTRFATVAQHLQQRFGIRTLVAWRGKDEQRLAASVVQQAKASAVLAPKTSAMELAALVDLGRVVIGADNGTLHVAAAVGTPTVALYGSSRLEETRPYGSHHIVLRVDETDRCRPRSTEAAMERISARMVCLAVEQQLAHSIVADAA